MAEDKIRTGTATIALGENLSAAATLEPGWVLIGVQTPSTWDTAKVSFQVSLDGSTYVVLFDKTTATEYSSAATIAASKYWPVDSDNFWGVRYIKIQSGTSAATTAQADETIVTLVFYKAT